MTSGPRGGARESGKYPPDGWGESDVGPVAIEVRPRGRTESPGRVDGPRDRRTNVIYIIEFISIYW